MKKQNEIEGLGESTSATFCASYFDTDSGITNITGYGCCYAFDHVRPNSVAEIYKYDGYTSLMSDILQPNISKKIENILAPQEPYLVKDINQKEEPPLTLAELADMENPYPSDFNEFLINRYDELGQPQKTRLYSYKGRRK